MSISTAELLPQRKEKKHLEPDKLLTKEGRGFIRSVVIARFGNQLDKHQIEDVTQRAWFTAHNEIKNLEDKNRFESWLRRLTINAGIDYQRRINSPLKRGGGSLHEVDVHTTNIPHQTSEDQSLWEAQETLKSRFASLTPDEQAVYRLTKDDLSLEQMATQLDWPLGTVKSRLHRASKKMRGEL